MDEFGKKSKFRGQPPQALVNYFDNDYRNWNYHRGNNYLGSHTHQQYNSRGSRNGRQINYRGSRNHPDNIYQGSNTGHANSYRGSDNHPNNSQRGSRNNHDNDYQDWNDRQKNSYRGSVDGQDNNDHGGRWHYKDLLDSSHQTLLEQQLNEILGPSSVDLPVHQIYNTSKREEYLEATCTLLAQQLLLTNGQLTRVTSTTVASSPVTTSSPKSPIDIDLIGLETPKSAKSTGPRNTSSGSKGPTWILNGQCYPPDTPGAPKMIDEILKEIRNSVQAKDAVRLRNILQVEPQAMTDVYHTLIAELRKDFPKGKDAALAKKCTELGQLDPVDSGSNWSAFPVVVFKHLTLIRDFELSDPNYLSTYNDLRGLLNQCIIALSDITYGVVILQTVLYLAKVLAKFALQLDRNPGAVAPQLQVQDAPIGDGASEKATFVESSANVVREAFIKCLSDKSGAGGLAGPGRRGKPENKRRGIYQTANLCLKLLFQCRKLRNAEQMFVSIDNQSPPLSYYPAAQRVEYLYYIGRFLFANNHFYRAQSALQEAYNQCHRQALVQRRLILIYLIASNLCLGRFPSRSLLTRPEADGLGDHFLPVCRLIARGDVSMFLRVLDVCSPQAQWFLHYRILLQIRDRCEVLVWRSLVRKVFIISGYKADADRGTVPYLRLEHIQAAFRILERGSQRIPLQESSVNSVFSFGNSQKPISGTSGGVDGAPFPIHDEFEGIDEAAAEAGFNIEEGYYYEDGVSKENARYPTNRTSIIDKYRQPEDITLGEIESAMSSLIQQGFLNGFLTHNTPRFAIAGAKARGPLATGFPPIWQTIEGRADVEVPGWVKEEKKSTVAIGASGFGGGLGGRVVNLSGARPAGAGP